MTRKLLPAMSAALIATPLLAAPSDMIATRVAGLRELGAAMKAVKDGIATPDTQTILIQQAARQISNAAGQMPGWFPEGSGPAPGVKTRARAEIWSDPQTFAARRNAFIAEAARFRTIANAGDDAAIRAEVPRLGATCGGCHETFREKEEHK